MKPKSLLVSFCITLVALVLWFSPPTLTFAQEPRGTLVGVDSGFSSPNPQFQLIGSTTVREFDHGTGQATRVIASLPNTVSLPGSALDATNHRLYFVAATPPASTVLTIMNTETGEFATAAGSFAGSAGITEFIQSLQFDPIRGTLVG